jgi:hypothetical protein
MKYIAFFLISVVSLLFILSELFVKPYSLEADPVESTFDRSASSKKSNQKGILIIKAGRWIPKAIVKKMLHSSSRSSGVVFYNWNKIDAFTASAQGLDHKHHIVNSYLVGYSPFRAINTWIPWQTLALKKKYQVDHLTYKGRKDVWQTSRQAYKVTRGDCEDHAIALADWLINMGNDARVVLGTHKGGGHAWVVLFKGGKEFLLEATQKSGLNTMRKFPLAKYQSGYHPKYMFNRTHFWKNTGSSSTKKYTSSKWIKMSKYTLGPLGNSS